MQETAIGKKYASNKVHHNCCVNGVNWTLNLVVVAPKPCVSWRCITSIPNHGRNTVLSFISVYNNSLSRDSIEYIGVIRKCIGLMHWLDDFDMKLFIFWRNSWIQELCYLQVEKFFFLFILKEGSISWSRMPEGILFYDYLSVALCLQY